jgi:hypothetical protein
MQPLLNMYHSVKGDATQATFSIVHHFITPYAAAVYDIDVEDAAKVRCIAR